MQRIDSDGAIPYPLKYSVFRTKEQIKWQVILAQDAWFAAKNLPRRTIL